MQYCQIIKHIDADVKEALWNSMQYGIQAGLLLYQGCGINSRAFSYVQKSQLHISFQINLRQKWLRQASGLKWTQQGSCGLK